MVGRLRSVVVVVVRISDRVMQRDILCFVLVWNGWDQVVDLQCGSIFEELMIYTQKALD